MVVDKGNETTVTLTSAVCYCLQHFLISPSVSRRLVDPKHESHLGQLRLFAQLMFSHPFLLSRTDHLYPFSNKLMPLRPTYSKEIHVSKQNLWTDYHDL